MSGWSFPRLGQGPGLWAGPSMRVAAQVMGWGPTEGAATPPPSLPGPPPGTGVELELGCALLNGACSIPDTVPGIVHQMVTTCVTGTVGAF